MLACSSLPPFENRKGDGLRRGEEDDGDVDFGSLPWSSSETTGEPILCCLARVPVEIYGVYLAAFKRLLQWCRSLSGWREESNGKLNVGDVGLWSLVELPEEVDEQESDRNRVGETSKREDDFESLSRPREAMSSMNEGTAAIGQCRRQLRDSLRQGMSRNRHCINVRADTLETPRGCHVRTYGRSSHMPCTIP